MRMHTHVVQRDKAPGIRQAAHDGGGGDASLLSIGHADVQIGVIAWAGGGRREEEGKVKRL